VSRRAVEAAADRFVPGFLAPHGEKLQYLVVGVFNTVFGYAVWAALYALLAQRLGYALVLVVSYAIAIANAYVWYRFVVFRSHNSVWRELPRFSAVYLATMVVNLIVFPIAVRRLPFNAYAIQAVFTLGVVVASYTAHKRISFRGPAGRRGRQTR
jgi:putative flippase GtrA